MVYGNSSSYKCFSIGICKSVPDSDTYDRHLFEFEKNFDTCYYFQWLIDNWKLCYYFIAFYLVAIFAGQHYMKSRQPFQLRGALLTWNILLAVFSIICAWRTVSAGWYVINQEGFYATLCLSHSKQTLQSLGIYLIAFTFSKIVELLDTAFIVLRKTPLIFLHWFHHATVCFFVWSCGAYPSNIHAYFMAMNYFVHAIMYSYYVLKVLKVRVPKSINMAITSLQLFQMLGGLFVTSYTYYMKAKPGAGCCVVENANNIALAIYFAYTILFGQFFIRAYLSKKPSSAASIKKSS